jgi:hypothetical protein
MEDFPKEYKSKTFGTRATMDKKSMILWLLFFFYHLL